MRRCFQLDRVSPTPPRNAVPAGSPRKQLGLFVLFVSFGAFVLDVVILISEIDPIREIRV